MDHGAHGADSLHQYHASRGSRCGPPVRVPDMVPELQASEIAPPSTWASIRRCPSIRVSGSITIRAISQLPDCGGHGFSGGPSRSTRRRPADLGGAASGGLASRAHLRTRRTGDSVQPKAVATPAVSQPPIFPASHPRRTGTPAGADRAEEPCPRTGRSASGAAVPGFHGPTGSIVHRTTGIVGRLRPFASILYRQYPRLAHRRPNVPRSGRRRNWRAARTGRG